MIKEKLSKIKNQIKKNAPQIAVAAAAVASVAYSIVLKQKLEEERRRFPEGKSTRLGVNECCFEELKGGMPVIWHIKGHKIDIAYDPDC